MIPKYRRCPLVTSFASGSSDRAMEQDRSRFHLSNAMMCPADFYSTKLIFQTKLTGKVITYINKYQKSSFRNICHEIWGFNGC